MSFANAVLRNESYQWLLHGKLARCGARDDIFFKQKKKCLKNICFYVVKINILEQDSV